MSNCGTCKHWTPPSGRTGFKQAFDAASDVKYGECNKVTLASMYFEPVPDPLPLAATMDASECQADLLTQPEFGCVLHEPQEAP
jgi:hypothetical protein